MHSTPSCISPRSSRGRRLPAARAAAAPLAGLPAVAHASFLPPALMDSAAWGIAWFVIVVVPLAAIVVFWMVHVLPEKIAHKRHHPQKDAIHVLCLLSLAFGGLLWPIAWLWAYTKPVSYRLAYGTDKHDRYFLQMAERAEAGQVGEHERAHLLDELDAIAARGALSREQKQARARIAAAPVATPPVGMPDRTAGAA